MRYNRDLSFVGVVKLKEAHRTQVAEFENWAVRRAWQEFHNGHYDWWAFPIDRASSYGLRWTVFDGEITILQDDKEFMDRLLRGMELVCASWGWDLPNQAYVPSPAEAQRWQDWPIRLHKAALSAKLFGLREAFASMSLYARDLMSQGKSMTYGGRDLGWLFSPSSGGSG